MEPPKLAIYRVHSGGNHYIHFSSFKYVPFPAAKPLIQEIDPFFAFVLYKFKVHKHNKELLDHFPAEVIPTEYGGSAGPLDDIIDTWVKKVQEYKTWMQEEEHFGTDESKRPGKPQTTDGMFGVEGSFKKLEID